MGLTASETSGTSFNPVSEGMHHAICYSIFDLGTQHNPVFDSRARKVLIVWELPEERIDIEKDGEEKNLPRAISKQYTLSLHEKSNLRKDLESWRGKAFTSAELAGFDVKNLLSVNCMLQVIHKTKNEKTYANITSVVSLYGKEKRTPENPIRFFSFEEDMEIPEGTPEWVEKLIKVSDEWQVKMNPKSEESYISEDTPPLDAYEDDVPF